VRRIGGGATLPEKGGRAPSSDKAAAYSLMKGGRAIPRIQNGRRRAGQAAPSGRIYHVEGRTNSETARMKKGPRSHVLDTSRRPKWNDPKRPDFENSLLIGAALFAAPAFRQLRRWHKAPVIEEPGYCCAVLSLTANCQNLGRAIRYTDWRLLPQTIGRPERATP